MKDTLTGLDWEDDYSSLNQELSNISLLRNTRGENSTNGASFLNDPNESISQIDEALGLEFASSMPSIPFVSTPIGQQQTKSPEREHPILDSYPPGFDKPANLGFHSLLPNNERTFSSSSNSSNTSFISENSFNNILRNTQQENAFRESSGTLSSTASYRPADGLNSLNSSGNDNSVFSRSIGSRLDDSFFPSNNSVNFSSDLDTSRWDFPNQSGGLPNTSSQASRAFENDLDPPRFFSSPRRDSKAPASLNNSELSFADSGNLSTDLGSRTSNSLFGSNSIWNSPNSNDNQRQTDSSVLSATRLTPKQALNLIPILNSLLQEKKENGDWAGVAQMSALLQQVQQQLIEELDSPTSPSPPTPGNSTSSGESSVDRAAKFHRDVAGTADAAFTWSGQLPPRIHRNPTYSCKIFLGGVPFDITENALIQAFKPFGNVKIEWPLKEAVPSQPKGYLYVIFEHEKQVKLLLQNCFLDYSKSIAGDWYFKLSSKRFREKDVQVIPWAMSDSNFVKCQAAKIDAKKTIFVGALHGMMNAEGLATIMNDLFNGVVYAGIDTDRHKYPIGSGRVTFNNHKSYMKAVSAAFVEIKTKFKKKVQVDPYLEDATCSVCYLQQGPYFCREWSCFRYFCRTCYQTQHCGDAYRTHRPIMRNANKPQGTPGAVTAATFYPANGNGGGNPTRNYRMNSNNAYGGGGNNWNTSYNNTNGFQRRNDYNNNNGNGSSGRFSQLR